MIIYLRAKTNGIVVEYNERLAKLPEWEVVTEQQAFPEKFAPVDLVVREHKVKLEIPLAAVKPENTTPELSAQKGNVFSDAALSPIPKTNKAKAKPILKAGLNSEG